MKIDIHVHTKKIKSGDSKAREINAKRFHEIISSTEVKIVAITNHNHFDLAQYEEFSKAVGDSFQIWPGIELDIVEDGRRGHLLVIFAENYVHSIEEVMNVLTKGISPDEFFISIDDVIVNFDKFSPLYIAHYKKSPDLSDVDIEKLIKKTTCKNRVLKEATNAISAGIFLAHGHLSIYGSDAQDWSKYQILSKDLPDLRLPVESFEQFCLLLNKDQTAIDTLLDKKKSEKISITPFGDKTTLELKVYNDINIIFGAKGTGKSKILEAIANYYTNTGIRTEKYDSGSEDIKETYDLKCKKNSLSIDFKAHEIGFCDKEIDSIKKAREIDVTSASRYRQFYSHEIKNKRAKIIKIKDLSTENSEIAQRNFSSVDAAYKEFTKFYLYLKSEKSVKEILKEDSLNRLIKNLTEIIDDLKVKRLNNFVEYKTRCLFNSLIEKVKHEVSAKIGVPKKPSVTGLCDYAMNRIKIEKDVETVLQNIGKKITLDPEYVGCLDEKGDLYCKTEIVIQDGSISNTRYHPISSKLKKNTQKEFSRLLKEIKSVLYTSQLFEKISALNSIEEIDSIRTILGLVMFEKYFTINGERYDPSSGESSMLLLHKELQDDKEVYILDEPEKSLGNEYISNVIVPLLKQKARLGKKVFIATHDANIAVRTLPYNSIYRMHKKDDYATFIGNPFVNYLKNIKNEDERLEWKDISMRTLEGGKKAFGERKQIYGQNL